MQITYEQLDGSKVVNHKGILELNNLIFEARETAIDPPVIKNLQAWLAYSGDQVIGYKVGYELKPGKYYSWIGGVHPNFRNEGIAGVLMMQQHEWCKLNGYQTIQTKTKNKWKSMLILNLKNGFDVIGTYTDSKGEPKIILEKNL
jgi:GNAT superfamily N-acetyltransferase